MLIALYRFQNIKVWHGTSPTLLLLCSRVPMLKGLLCVIAKGKKAIIEVLHALFA